MPSRPRFALCTAISPSHPLPTEFKAHLPRASKKRPSLFADRPSQFASSPSQRSLPILLSINLSIPTQPPGFLRHTRLRLRCCSALLHSCNTKYSLACRTAAAADQTSPNQSINQSHSSIDHTRLPSPSRLRHPRLREWLDFPLPHDRQGPAVFTAHLAKKGSSRRWLLLHAVAYTSSPLPLRRFHLRIHTDARRLLTAANPHSPLTKRGCARGNATRPRPSQTTARLRNRSAPTS